MGEKCGTVPNGELPSLRPEDINWRPPYSDVIPPWKDISNLAHVLDSMDRLPSNPLLWHYPENGTAEFLGGKVSCEIEHVYGELHRSLMLACHVYWRERRQPRLFDWFRRWGLPGIRGAELRARLWLESTAWEYSRWVRRILEVFGCEINDINFEEPPVWYWNMVDRLLDSMPINRDWGFVDERGVLLRWMHLHGQRPTEDTLNNVW